MPKRLVNGELIDVVDSAPSTRTSSNASSAAAASSSLSFAAVCCPTPPSTLKEAVFYSVPAWGKQVPLLGLFAVLLVLGLVAGKQASLTTAMVAGLLLVLGYSPDSTAESASSAHSSGSSSSSGLSGIRTVRDLPPTQRPGG